MNKLEACVELFAKNRLADTKTYDGCENCFGAVNKSESVITLWTQWESAEHFDRYMEWRTERGDFAEVLAYFTGEPKITRSELFFSQQSKKALDSSQQFGLRLVYTSTPVITIAAPPSAPELSIRVTQVEVNMKLTVGKRYTIEASKNMVDWVQAGDIFTAEEQFKAMKFDVDDFGQFYRVIEQP